MNKVMLGVVPALLCAVLGCVEGRTPTEKFHSRMRADPVPLSDFLPDHALLKKQPNTFPFHYFYLKDDAPTCDSVYVAPVDISQLRKSDGWAEFDKAMAGSLGTKMEDLTAFMKKAYEQAFRKRESTSHIKVLDAPSKEPGALVIETALIAFRPTKAELTAAGIAANFVLPGIGIVASALSSGSLTIECRIRDAATGKILSMYATTETDPRAVFSAAQLTWSSSAQINIKRIAGYTAEVYFAARDYRKVHRKFPISWTALIKDAKLDED